MPLLVIFFELIDVVLLVSLQLILHAVELCIFLLLAAQDCLLASGCELFLPISFAHQATLLASFDLVLDSVPHVLDLIFCIFGDLGHLHLFVSFKLSELVLLLSLVGDLLLFIILCDLIQTLLHQLINSRYRGRDVESTPG